MYFNQYRRSEPFSYQPTVLNIYPTTDWIAESARILAHDVEKKNFWADGKELLCKAQTNASHGENQRHVYEYPQKHTAESEQPKRAQDTNLPD